MRDTREDTGTMNLDLDAIAATLEGLEETIITRLIDRAQFLHNPLVYQAGHSGFDGEVAASLLDLRLLYQERMDAEFGRFCVPEERAFSRSLPSPRRAVKLQVTGLALEDPTIINLTMEILHSYKDLVSRICREGDDGHYGSSVEHDVYALQAISRRVHYGALYVAECKFQQMPEEYRPVIRRADTSATMELLTRTDVEERIVRRVGEKVESLQSTANTRVRHLVDPAVVVQFYRDHVIPLTKKGEILYLLQRPEQAPVVQTKSVYQRLVKTG